MNFSTVFEPFSSHFGQKSVKIKTLKSFNVKWPGGEN